MMKSYKYRLYPTESQKKSFEETFGVCRLVYNLGLGIKIDAWRTAQKNIMAFDLCRQLVDLKNEYPWIKAIDSQALQISVKKIDTAYINFFKGSNRPLFKKKSGKQSFQTISSTIRVDFEKGLITLPKIPNIPIAISRIFTGKIKNVTVSKTPTGKYFASVLVDTLTSDPDIKIIREDETLGIDLGITDMAILSNGVKFGNPSYLKNGIDRIKILQRRSSKKKRGSNSRKKAYKKISILHEQIRNRRIDFLHKLTTKLVSDSQTTTFCMENLSVKNMIKNHKLAQAISDVSWFEFKSQMRYKCAWAGKNLIIIDRFEPSSKTCSICGTRNETLTLNQRFWDCEKCNANHDRDINAAQNIKIMGLNKSGQGMPVAPIESLALARTLK